MSTTISDEHGAPKATLDPHEFLYVGLGYLSLILFLVGARILYKGAPFHRWRNTT